MGNQHKILNYFCLVCILYVCGACTNNTHNRGIKFAENGEVLNDSLTYMSMLDDDSVTLIKLPDLNNSGSRLIYTDELIDSIWYVPLETNKQSIFGGIEHLKVHNNKVYIVDNASNSVLLFGLDGKFIKKIGRTGNAPGEYINPVNITVNAFNNRFLIYDDKQRKLLIHDLDGNFLQEKPIGFRMNDFVPLSDSAYLVNIHLSENRHIPEIAESLLLTVDTNWQIQSAGMPGSVNICSDFSHARDGIYTSASGHLYNPTFSNTIYQYQGDTIVPKYVFDAGSMNLPPDFLCGLSFDEYIEKYDNPEAPYGFIDKPIIETDTWLITSFRFRLMNVYLFYSKDGGRYHWSIMHQMDPESKRFATLTPIRGMTDEDTFYGYIDGVSLYNEIQRAQENQELLLGDELTQLEPDDNPVLIFYRLKPDNG